MRLPLALCFATLVLAAGLPAQTFTTSPCTDDSDGVSSFNWFGGPRARFCELRRTTLPLTGGHVAVLARNGAIVVLGEDRNDIALEAKVSTRASSQAEARSLAREIIIRTVATIEPHGPNTSSSNPSWTVSFRLHVPHRIAAELRTYNGSISLSALNGVLRANTTNGGLELQDLAGDVTAITTNGAVSIKLSGEHWTGKGLDAQTTNGGIALTAARTYSAHLIAQTTNGGIAIAMPITVQGTIGKHLDTNLGQGGATLHLQTTNGGISLKSR